MISQIFHLADIHIRKGNYVESRFHEYLQVFEETIKNIKDLHKPNECITVICGDIFHHKLQISSHGIVLFYKLIYSLADIMPVLMIQGNHDLIQENDDLNNDLIKALLHNRKHDNVIYVDSTSSFEYNTNLHFGVVSIREMLQRYSGSGMVESLPKFPLPKGNRLNVAISHTTILNCTLHNYSKATNGTPLEWFKGYDLVLLGDVHLQSAKYSKKHELYYGYPGSLIQQDFGESIFNHGFLLWNINENNEITLEKYHVQNDFARANIRINEQLFINSDNYEVIDEFFKRNQLPKEIHLRLYCKESTDIPKVRSELENLMIENNIEPKIDVLTTNISMNTTENESIMDSSIKDLTCSDTIIEFFKSNGNQTLLDDNPNWEKIFINIETIKIPIEDILPDQIKELITNKNEKINKRIENAKTIKGNNSQTQNTLQIKTIHFDWILAFGKDNVFTFSNNTITLMNAPNGYGKSAFFECLTLGLFGETIPSRFNKSTALSILNKRKPQNIDSSSVRIIFLLNNKDTYTIIREFHEYTDSRNKSVKRLGSNKVELYENGSLIKTGTRVVTGWINDNVCTLQDFLLSTMITQNFDNDFFKLKPSEQGELLDSVLNMKIVNSTCNVISDARKEYRDLRNHMETFIQAKKSVHIFDLDKYNMYLKRRDIIQKDLESYQNTYNELNILPSKHLEDNLEEPKESLDDLIIIEKEITKELNVLEIDSNDTPQTFDTFDLSASQFEVDTNGITINLNKVNRLISKYKHESIKSLVVQFREATDEYEFAKYNLDNIILTKPNQNTDHTMDEYEEFLEQYELIKKKTKKITVVDDPDFDIDIEEPEYMNQYEDMSEEELIELSKQTSKNIDGYVSNPDCDACIQNFGSEKSIHAINILDYRRKGAYLKKWRIYQKKKHFVEQLKELEDKKKYWERIVPIIQLNNEYKDNYNEHSEIVYEKQLYRIHISKAIIDIIQYQNKCNQGNALLIKLNEVVYKLKYYSNEKLKTKIIIDKLNREMVGIQLNIGSMESIQLQEKEYNEIRSSLMDTMKMLERRIPLYVYIVDAFSKYKSWIYNHKVLPVIVNRTNSILNMLFSNRCLKLNFDLNDIDIMFTVEDEGNIVNMEKLSGAQSFAVSLSFRLALSAVGISRFRCNQLFIDEGFCSFDQHNLLNVPVLIKNLKQLYDEIVLVTHLEEIKSCADKVVNIERINGISKIVNK